MNDSCFQNKDNKNQGLDRVASSELKYIVDLRVNCPRIGIAQTLYSQTSAAEPDNHGWQRTFGSYSCQSLYEATKHMTDVFAAW